MPLFAATRKRSCQSGRRSQQQEKYRSLTAAVPAFEIIALAAIAIITTGARVWAAHTIAVGAADMLVGLRGVISIRARQVIVAEHAAAVIIVADLLIVDKWLGGACAVVCCSQKNCIVINSDSFLHQCRNMGRSPQQYPLLRSFPKQL